MRLVNAKVFANSGGLLLVDARTDPYYLLYYPVTPTQTGAIRRAGRMVPLAGNRSSVLGTVLVIIRIPAIGLESYCSCSDYYYSFLFCRICVRPLAETAIARNLKFCSYVSDVRLHGISYFCFDPWPTFAAILDFGVFAWTSSSRERLQPLSWNLACRCKSWLRIKFENEIVVTS